MSFDDCKYLTFVCLLVLNMITDEAHSSVLQDLCITHVDVQFSFIIK